MKRLLTTLAALFWIGILFGQKYLPSVQGELVEHTYISLSYCEEHEQAEWVYYELTPEFVTGKIKRSDNFRPDPKVSTLSAQLEDYAGSGYDRGHLCPAGSMTLNPTAMSESFYMSNMSPQVPTFNRGGWKQLESLVRNWVIDNEHLYVITGPILDGAGKSIGPNRVTVPNSYYKVIYAPGSQQMIAFVMPNAKIDRAIESYAVTVNEVERLTGINFFVELDDDVERKLEAIFDLNQWNFKNTTLPKTVAESVSEENVTKNQCQGITKSGSRCKRSAKAGSRYCYQHENL